MRSVYKQHRRTIRAATPRPFTDTCLVHHCETEVPADHGFQLCERHLAKAWAAYEITHGRPTPAPGPEETVDIYDDTTPGAIYFARVGDLLKIGWTSKLAERLTNLKADAVLHIEQGTRADEHHYHQLFADHLARGKEWFHCNEETTQLLDDKVRQHV